MIALRAKFQRVSLLGLLCLAATNPTVVQAKPLIETINGEQPIQLKSVQVNGDISGSVAETTVRLVVYNPNNRPLEGRLQFPLLPGQQITAFALDIDGAMRAAVPVEKVKGRKILEEVERRRIDPALLENTEGNNFSLKIFPVPAAGTRTVELRYTEALGKTNGHWAYHLPLAYGDDPFDLDLTLKADSKSLVKGTLGQMAFQPDRGGFTAHLAKPRFHPGGTIDVQVAASNVPKTILHERDGEIYFVTEIPVAGQTAERPKPLLKVIELLWDCSGSGANRSQAAELVELDRYFQAIGQAKVKLTRLRDHAEAAEDFDVSNGDWSALRKALENTVYDGASGLTSWTPHSDVNEYLLFSDGMVNYGSSKFPALPADVRLYALNSALSADTDRLSAVAEATGGKLVQIDSRVPGVAAGALLRDDPAILNLRGEGAEALLADTSQARHGFVRVAGKLTAQSATLRFTLSQSGQIREMTVPVDMTAPNHPIASSLWANLRLRGLQANYELHRGEIRRLGEKFGIPTRETSLLVLERAEDYVRYDVAPPPELKTAVERLKAVNGQMMSQNRAKQLDNVVRQFAEKIAWWEKEYDKSDPVPEKKVVNEDQDAGTSVASAGTAAAVMAPAPAPAAAPARASGAVPAPAAAAARPEPAVSATTPSPEIGIALKKWQADAPYSTRMRSATTEDVYAVYLDEKPTYANSPAFFLDAADTLFDKGQRDLALRVLSNLAEMDLDNRQILRVLGYRLLQAQAPELAVPVFEKVLRLADDEPQSFRDLGLAYAANKQYQQAINNLNEVVLRPWNGRFAEIELIALAEMNAIVAMAPDPLDTSAIDPRLLKNLPLDIRVVMTWDTNDTDMDLWVTDPNGEKCFYGHRFTRQGGRNSVDYTMGYGPEEFSLRKAKPGKYKIEVNFYGSRQQLVSGATTLNVKLITGFGAPNANEKDISLRLKSRAETVYVGEFEVK